MAEEFTREMLALHLRLDALRHEQQQRMTELAWRSEGMPVTALERQEGHEGWYDMQDDDGEADVTEMLTQMAHRMNELQQARVEEQQRGQEQGMGY
jgi:hypothetical protein